MKILLCVNGTPKNIIDRLTRIIVNVVPADDIHICRQAQDLALVLRSPLERFSVAVLVASNDRVLESFLSIKELFENLFIVLILHNRNKETIHKGHLLRPRFITYVDGTLEDIEVVLNKVVKHIASKNVIVQR